MKKEALVPINPLYEFGCCNVVVGAGSPAFVAVVDSILIECRYDAKVLGFTLGTAAPVFTQMTSRCMIAGGLLAVDGKFTWESDGFDVTVSAKTPLGQGKVQVWSSDNLLV